MNKLCVVLTIIGLIGFMFAFTGCEKAGRVEKAPAEPTITQTADQVTAAAEKKADKAVVQEKAKAEQAKPEKKAKSKKGKAQQKQAQAKVADSKQANKTATPAGTVEKKAEAVTKK